MFMDEIYFAQIQKTNCWFTFAMMEDLPPIQANMDDVIKTFSNDKFVQRHLFAMIFGAFGYPLNLRAAEILILSKLTELNKREPEKKTPENEEFVIWLNLFSQYYVLLGTIYAYQHEYVKAAYCLMNGLKTGCINLFMPYCDFIKYVLSKVAEMPADLAEYDGCGFSVEEPMGGLEVNNGSLDASAAEMIIPALEGVNGEIVLSYQGGQKYGNLKRLGSTNSNNFRNCVDVYEVLMVDRNFKLKKLIIYFNGYFYRDNRFTIRLLKGFRIDPLNKIARYYQIM